MQHLRHLGQRQLQLLPTSSIVTLPAAPSAYFLERPFASPANWHASSVCCAEDGFKNPTRAGAYHRISTMYMLMK